MWKMLLCYELNFERKKKKKTIDKIGFHIDSHIEETTYGNEKRHQFPLMMQVLTREIQI
jgi:hypothetical protein